ncbi:MAG: cyclase family protein [Verrucomicrobia bacterium]|nr:cyclase family protein [Verrucomicrobiota bacterium]
MSDSSAEISAGKLAPYGALPVPRLTPDLVSLIKTGTVYSLAVIYREGILVPGPMAPYTLNTRFRHGDIRELAPASAAAEAITMSCHTGTHIDALCHIGEAQDKNGNADPAGEVKLYASPGKTVAAADQVDLHGQKHLSIAEMPPIVQRGVLLDIAGNLGVSILPDCYQITVNDVESTLQKQNTEIRPQTAVLIRTGFYQHLAAGNPACRDAIAGLSLEAAKSLHRYGMNLVGADNMSVEAVPPLDHSVHRYFLVHNGITHVENLYLEDLAKEQVYEFLLIITPLRLAGATGSWVHPIAIT